MTINTNNECAQDYKCDFKKQFCSYVINNNVRGINEDGKTTQNVTLFLRHFERLSMLEYVKGDTSFLLNELHLWCNDIVDRVELALLASEIKEELFAQKIMLEAYSMVDDYSNGYMVLSQNKTKRLLSSDKLNLLFKKTVERVNEQDNYSLLASLGVRLQVSNEYIEFCIYKASEFHQTFDSCLNMAEYYSFKDEEKSWDWYLDSFEFWEDAGHGEDILSSLNRCELSTERIESIADKVITHKMNDAEDKHYLFEILSHSVFCSDQLLVKHLGVMLLDFAREGNWNLMEACMEHISTPDMNQLKNILRHTDAMEPEHISDMLSYAKYMKLLFDDKEAADYWCRAALDRIDDPMERDFHSQLDVFLSIANYVWELLMDSDLVHKILWSALKHPYGLKETNRQLVYKLRLKSILPFINETSQCAVELKRYFDLILSEEHLSKTYSFATRMASDNCQHQKVIDDLFTKTGKTAVSFSDAYELYQLTTYVDDTYADFFHKYHQHVFHLMDDHIQTTQDALKLAKEVQDWPKYKDRLDSLIGKALELATKASDYRDVARFYNLILRDTPLALKYLKMGLGIAQTADEFKMFSQEAKLILGRNWETAF